MEAYHIDRFGSVDGIVLRSKLSELARTRIRTSFGPGRVLARTRPLPSTNSASEMSGEFAGKIACSRRRRSLSGKERKSVPSAQRISKAT